jgi:hypothetical protein
LGTHTSLSKLSYRCFIKKPQCGQYARYVYVDDKRGKKNKIKKKEYAKKNKLNKQSIGRLFTTWIDQESDESF